MKRSSHHKWVYRNTTLLLLSFLVLYFVADIPFIHNLIAEIGEYGYLGAFLAGTFFVSIFTVAPATLVLFHLAQDLNPVLIAVSAGTGGVIGDLLIFHFLRDGVFEELKLLFKDWKFSRADLFKSKYFFWVSPVLGAVIIASPFPDEVGIGLLGLSRIRPWQFIGLTFVLNTLGILAIVLLAETVGS